RWLFIAPRKFWLALATSAVALLVGFRIVPLIGGRSELGVRIAGVLLTVAGVALSLRGIVAALAQFERQSLGSRVAGWLSEFPKAASVIFKRAKSGNAFVYAGSGGI